MTDRASLEKVTTYIDRCIRRLIVHIHSKYKFDEFDRSAIRLLESRKRLLFRIWDAEHEPNPTLRQNAKIELTLKNHDIGTIIELHGRNHVVGWFGCRACDIDSYGAISISSARLCTACKDGVQHACSISEESVDQVPSKGWVIVVPGQPLMLSDELPGTSSQAISNSRATVTPTLARPVYSRVYVCDNCGHQENA